MRLQLNDSEFAIVERVERELSAWRYSRWLQLMVGVLIFFWGVAQSEHFLPALRTIHPNLVSLLGALIAGAAIWERSAKERRLLLKLFRASQSGAA